MEESRTIRSGMWSFEIEKSVLERAGLTAEDVARSIRKWDLSLYGVYYDPQDQNILQRIQFRLGFPIRGKRPNSNVEETFAVNNMGPAFYSEQNQNHGNNYPAESLLGVGQSGVRAMNNNVPIQVSTFQASLGDIVDNSFFYDKEVVVQYICNLPL